MQQHLRQLFAHLRHELGIRYFKLDANFWGAPFTAAVSTIVRLPASKPTVAGCRRSSKGSARGLSCWAVMRHFGPPCRLVHGMRVADDVERSGHRIRQIAREIFSRAWQADRLWQLDPDCLCLEHQRLLALAGEAGEHANGMFNKARF